MKNSNHRLITIKQYLIALITVIIIIVIFYILITLGEDKKQAKKQEEKYKINITNPAISGKLQDRWLATSEQKLLDLAQQDEENNNKVNNLANQLAKMQNNFDILSQQNEKIDNLYQEIDLLNQQIQAKKNSNQSEKIQNESNIFSPSSYSENNLSNINNNIIAIQEINIALENSNINEHKTHNLEFYIPAGSYAPAKLTSAIDASVGVKAQTDPRPVLLRITDLATTAAHNNIKQTINIKGCMIIGAASGDISSEKVFIRLLKMTCSPKQGQVIETDVEGYVSSLGKAGIRGKVVSREGNLVAKSFMAGLVGGLGKSVASKFSSPYINNSNDLQLAYDNKDMAFSSIASGVESSSDRVSEYLINRAEQYQPVISIASGIEVEVVFNKGFYIDGRNINQGKSKI